MMDDVERALIGAVRICDQVAGEGSVEAVECAVALATHLHTIGQHEQARDALGRLDSLQPDGANADAAVRGLHLLGTIHHEMGHSEKAFEVLPALETWEPVLLRSQCWRVGKSRRA